MRWYERIIAAHTAVTKSVSHLRRMKSVTGSTDLYTKVEFDPWAQALGPSLDRFGISWGLRDVQYEEDTGFTHYTWDWEVMDGDD